MDFLSPTKGKLAIKAVVSTAVWLSFLIFSAIVFLITR